jgi:hypothetical protein
MRERKRVGVLVRKRSAYTASFIPPLPKSTLNTTSSPDPTHQWPGRVWPRPSPPRNVPRVHAACRPLGQPPQPLCRQQALQPTLLGRTTRRSLPPLRSGPAAAASVAALAAAAAAIADAPRPLRPCRRRGGWSSRRAGDRAAAVPAGNRQQRLAAAEHGRRQCRRLIAAAIPAGHRQRSQRRRWRRRRRRRDDIGPAAERERRRRRSEWFRRCPASGPACSDPARAALLGIHARLPRLVPLPSAPVPRGKTKLDGGAGEGSICPEPSAGRAAISEPQHPPRVSPEAAVPAGPWRRRSRSRSAACVLKQGWRAGAGLARLVRLHAPPAAYLHLCKVVRELLSLR